MRKMTFVSVILSLLFGACSSPNLAAQSPCDLVMPEDQFAQQYAGKQVTFMGVYSFGTVYAYEVEEKTVCVTDPSSDPLSFPEFLQDVVDEKGNKYTEDYPILNDRFNGLIGRTGTFGLGQTFYQIHNTQAIQLKGRPDECVELDADSVKQFDGKEILVVGYNHSDEHPLPGIYFENEGQTYCYEAAYPEVRTSVVDITGKKVLAEYPSWTFSRSHFMNLTATVKFDAETVSTRTAPDDEWTVIPVMHLIAGDASETEYGDSMVFEVMSRPGSVEGVDSNSDGKSYKIINSDKPETVKPGYLYSPIENVDGGELQVGSYLGPTYDTPLLVTEIKCALGGFSFVPVQVVHYLSTSISGDTMVYPDTYIFFVEGMGEGQRITYYRVPPLAPGCPMTKE
jgi:hypothetical protein